MDRSCPLNGRGTNQQEGRTMLLTNTLNTQTINTTIATGNAIVCGVEISGCPVRPATLADRPSEKPAAKRISERARRLRGRAMRAMYLGDQRCWQQQGLDQRLSHSSTASGHRLGRAFGRSLS